MGANHRRGKPICGDSIVDNFFFEIVHIVENVFDKIYKKKVLKDPDDRRRRLYAFLSDKNSSSDPTEVYITHTPHAPAAKNMTHEALHALFPDFVRERRIRKFENDLWRRFTDEQKRFLRKYVPKHTVKKEP